MAAREGRVLLTNDKDFGDLVFRDGETHAGIIPFRVGYMPIDARIDCLRQALIDHAHELDRFIVLSTQGSRVATGRRPKKSSQEVVERPIREVLAIADVTEAVLKSAKSEKGEPVNRITDDR